MDLGTIIGIFSGIGLVVVSIMLVSPIGAFIDVPGSLIVIGGTFASTLVAFPMSSFISSLKATVTLFTTPKINTIESVKMLVKAADIARKGGGIALEEIKPTDEFMALGFQLVADGTEAREVEDLMANEMEATLNRRTVTVKVLDKMGELSPAWGMIGTLIGLVVMLLNLSDPGAIGPSMAIALLTTFYGALMANFLFIPASTKLGDRAVAEQLNMRLIAAGSVAISKNENPRQVQQRLMGMMPPDIRSQMAAKKMAAKKK